MIVNYWWQLRVEHWLIMPQQHRRQHLLFRHKQNKFHTPPLDMGGQSQSCKTNTWKVCDKPKYQLKKYLTVKQIQQKTLVGGIAFNPIRHCKVCRAKNLGYPPPHRGHDKHCWNNKQTKGKSDQTLFVEQETFCNIEWTTATSPWSTDSPYYFKGAILPTKVES